MSKLTSNHYGVEISLDYSSFPQCCGAISVHRFKVIDNGGLSKLTLEQKIKMYDEIMHNVAKAASGIVVAADCVLNFGEWANLGRHGGGGGTSWSAGKGTDRGDISLEDFCEHYEWTRGPVGRNRNSGNFVASFSTAIYQPDEGGSDEITYNSPEMPDFSDDETATRSDVDLDTILAELEAAVRSARNA